MLDQRDAVKRAAAATDESWADGATDSDLD
jgi:hypothetical protein